MSKTTAVMTMVTLALALGATSASAHQLNPGAWTTQTAAASTVSSAKADKPLLLAGKPDCKNRKGTSNPCS